MTTLRQQAITEGREALSRVVRQVLQALTPTLFVLASGSTVGIDVVAVLTLAGVTALVSILKSLVGFRVESSSVWPHLAERAATAAAGTALGFITIDGIIPATAIDWRATLAASVGAALVSATMWFTNPPLVPGEIIGPVVDERIIGDSIPAAATPRDAVALPDADVQHSAYPDESR